MDDCYYTEQKDLQRKDLDISEESRISNPAGIIDGQLYKVIYDKAGEAKELKLVKNLKPYDTLSETAVQS